MIDTALIGGITNGLIKAWRRGGRSTRVAIALAGGALSFAALVLIGMGSNLIPRPVGSILAAALAVPSILVLLFAGASINEEQRNEQQRELRAAETRLREEPDKPTVAWEVARLNLQNYIDRNLSQVSWIFSIIILVMSGGFFLVVFGIWESWSAPEKISGSLIAAGSGVLVQFIAATFLIIYRSTNEQAREYVGMLERINAVGMSAQILEGLSEERQELRDQARIEIAKGLLTL